VLRQNVDVDIPLPMNREKMIARDGIEHQKTIAQPRHCPSDRVPANTPHNVLFLAPCHGPDAIDLVPILPRIRAICVIFATLNEFRHMAEEQG